MTSSNGIWQRYATVFVFRKDSSNDDWRKIRNEWRKFWFYHFFLQPCPTKLEWFITSWNSFSTPWSALFRCHALLHRNNFPQSFAFICMISSVFIEEFRQWKSAQIWKLLSVGNLILNEISESENQWLGENGATPYSATNQVLSLHLVK